MSAARDLLNALIDFHEGYGRAGDTGATGVLDQIGEGLRNCREPATPAPRALPAADLVLPAIMSVPDPLAAVAGAIGAAMPLFRWRQNPNYNFGNMGAAFMAGYGYVEFAGPKDALFHAASIRVGLLVLGSHLHYPPHAHPAEEVYHPLTDGAAWRRGSEPWRKVPAGQAIHHPPMLVHETRAGETTLLALYGWIGDTATEARLA